MQTRPTKQWRLGTPVPPEVDQALTEYPPYLRQILYNRGYCDSDSARRFLSATGYQSDPFLLKDMEIAVERLLRAVDAGESLAIYGDYDVDGVTATVLLTQVLRSLGGNARPYIPNRFDEGYGLNNEALDSLAEEGVKVVVTVDCGIRSLAEVEHGRDAGLDMIISDHHSPLGDVPAAAIAVICQRQPGDTYPDKNLAGVGLAYKIAQALYARKGMAESALFDWLDLVALGTVADVVPLVGENRTLVRAGLECIRSGRRCGLFSLAQASGINNVERCSAGEIGFILGPRLNAAGRLDSALDAVKLLMADDINQAAPMAQRLDDQNKRRQEITREMQARAEVIALADGGGDLLVAFDSEFSSGIVGLVAARLTESQYRPSIVGQRNEETTRASCRSIDEFHITKALDECADLLVRHGGHAKAAGFTVRNENLDALVSRMRAIAARELGDKDLHPVLRADLEIPLVELHPRIFIHLDQLEPTGLENPEVVFVTRNLKVTRFKTVGAEGNHLRLTVSDGRLSYDGIAFRQGHWAAEMPERIDLLYTFERNYYRGEVGLQLNVRDIKPADTPD